MTTSTDLSLDINTIQFEQQKAFGITEANSDEILQAASSIRLNSCAE